MTQLDTEVQVRPGVESDLVALTDIYNHYVRETAVTFDIAPFAPEQRLPWLLSHPEDGPHRLLVAQDVRDVDEPSGTRPGSWATPPAARSAPRRRTPPPSR